MTYTCYDGILRDAIDYYYNEYTGNEYYDDSGYYYNKYWDGDSAVDECISDFTNAPETMTLMNVETFTTTCVSGACLEIAKRNDHYGHYGHHRHHHRKHFSKYG